MKKQRHKSFPVFLGALMIILGGCYPKGPEYVEDLDMVVTNHDADFNFQSIGTYAIPDRVVKITGNVVDGEEVEYVNDIYTQTILVSIRQNMERYGWTEVDRDADPDVIILPSAISSTTVIWYYDYWYWDWWYPYSYWGWYYPYSFYGGSYTTGSVFLQMTHPDGITAADNIPVIWSSILNGLLEGSTSNINDRIGTSIDQAFSQSAYLDHSNNN